jgi:hypothetical protein
VPKDLADEDALLILVEMRVIEMV